MPNYLFGWQAVRRADGTAGVVFHAGGHPRSFGSEMRFYPARDVVVIVLCNLRHDDVRMSEDVIANVSDYFNGRDSVLVALPDVVLPSAHSRLTGRYVTPTHDTLVVWQDRTANLWMAPVGQNAVDMVYGRDSADRRDTTSALGLRRTLDSLSQLQCPAAGALDGRISTRELRSAYLGSAWCEWKRDGDPVTRILAIAPRTYSKTRTFIATETFFGRTRHVVAWEFDGANFIKGWSSQDVPWPQSRLIGSTPNGQFVLYDWFTARHATVTFVQDERTRRIATLQVDTGGAKAEARRIP
jgi:hypothetical protein